MYRGGRRVIERSKRNRNGAAHYRVKEFAELAGVTVKALRHYDRLGLLKPARTGAGHRTYSTRDLERLRQILALKRVGVPLTRMRPLLDAGREALTAFLHGKREELAREQERLAVADRALALVEEGLTSASRPRPALSVLADVIDTPRDADPMARYFSDGSWHVARRFYENWPDPEWIPLYRDITAAVEEGSGPAQDAELVRRWNTLACALWRDMAPDLSLSRKLHEGFARAWRDREHWPETLKRRFADYRMDDVAGFLKRASMALTSIAAVNTREERSLPKVTP